MHHPSFLSFPHFPPFFPISPPFSPIFPHFPPFFLAMGTLWVRLWVQYPPPEPGTSEPCNTEALCQTPPPPQTKGTIGGKNEICNRENLIGPFLVDATAPGAEGLCRGCQRQRA